MNSGVEPLERAEVLGVPLHAARMDQAVEACRRAVVERRPLTIGVVNAAKLVHMRDDPLLRRSVLSSDLVLADGQAVVWASRLLGSPLPERVAGIDLFQELLALADREGFTLYLLGGREEVVQDVAQRIRESYPSARIAGLRNGYFEESEEAQIAKDIATADPDILFVAISTPKKELFLARWSGQLGVRVCHGVGGSFDVFSGRISRAPTRWRQLGLEWLHRLLQEPRRMWRRYLVTNSVFLAMVGAERIRRLVRSLSGAK